MSIHLILCLMMMMSGDGTKWLSQVSLFSKDSYFKVKVYQEHTVKSFYALKEPHTTANPANYDMHLLSASLFFATNKLREDKKLPPLKFSEGLRNAAVVHTHQMVIKDFFAHLNPKTPALRHPSERLKMFGVNSPVNGENIDLNSFPVPVQQTYLQIAEVLVKDLYDSPPHRKAMLDKNFIYLGCAALFDLKDENYARSVRCTQDFCGNY